MESAGWLDATEDGLEVVHIYLIIDILCVSRTQSNPLAASPDQGRGRSSLCARQIVSHFTAASAHLIILGWVVVSFVGANEMKRL